MATKNLTTEQKALKAAQDKARYQAKKAEAMNNVPTVDILTKQPVTETATKAKAAKKATKKAAPKKATVKPAASEIKSNGGFKLGDHVSFTTPKSNVLVKGEITRIYACSEAKGGVMYAQVEMNGVKYYRTIRLLAEGKKAAK